MATTRRSRQSAAPARSRTIVSVICFLAGGLTATFIFFSAGFAPHVARATHGASSKPTLRRTSPDVSPATIQRSHSIESGSTVWDQGTQPPSLPKIAGDAALATSPPAPLGASLRVVPAPRPDESGTAIHPNAQPAVDDGSSSESAVAASASPAGSSQPADSGNHGSRGRDDAASPALPGGIIASSPPASNLAPAPSSLFTAKRFALINTYDTHSDVVATAHSGGPSGEIVIRNCLQQGLEALNFEVHLVTSLQTLRQQCEHPEQSFGRYSFIVLDENSIGGDGQLEPCFRGLQDRIFFLDFFGLSDKIQRARVPATRVLTPYPYPDPARGWAKGRDCEQASRLTFLGFFLEPPPLDVVSAKSRMAVVWGKEDRYLSPHRALLTRLAQRVELHTTSRSNVLGGTTGVVHHGFVPRDQFAALLRQSRVFLGLGDPLVGPAALEAMASGNVLVNPVLRSTKDPRIFTSQQPFLEHAVGPPRVCTVDLGDAEAVDACLAQALEEPAPLPYVPPAYTRSEYMQRLRAILERHLVRARGSLRRPPLTPHASTLEPQQQSS